MSRHFGEVNIFTDQNIRWIGNKISVVTAKRTQPRRSSNSNTGKTGYKQQKSPHKGIAAEVN